MTDDLKSPCIGVCFIPENGKYCEGCLRTRDEIAGWLYYNAPQKLGLMKELGRRKNTLKKS